MARTIAANAAYPSVGHIPLRRELDDATGMGAERLIIDCKARTAHIKGQHCLPFPLCCRQSGLLGSRPRSGTTKKDLLRSEPQIKASGGTLGNTATFSISLHPAIRPHIDTAITAPRTDDASTERPDGVSSGHVVGVQRGAVAARIDRNEISVTIAADVAQGYGAFLRLKTYAV